MAVLDTAFLIDLERGDTRAGRAYAALLAQDEPLVVPAQAAIEYLAGLDDPLQAFHQLGASFAVVGVGQEQILQAARMAHQSLQRGLRASWADLQIASLALLEATFVVTADAEPFRGLGCKVWAYRTQPAPPGKDKD